MSRCCPRAARLAWLFVTVLAASACQREERPQRPDHNEPTIVRYADDSDSVVDMSATSYHVVPPISELPQRELMIERDSRRVIFSPFVLDTAAIETPDPLRILLSSIIDITKLNPRSFGVEVRLESNLPTRTFLLPFDGRSPKDAEFSGLTEDLAALITRIETEGPLLRDTAARIVELLPPPIEYWVPPVRAAEQTVFQASIANASAWQNPIHCRIDAVSDGARTTLFEETFRFDNDPVWRDLTVPLGEFAGRNVQLVLICESPSESLPVAPDSGGWFAPVWADVMLLNEGDVPRAKGQNLILISLDTVRADHLGCYGYTKNTTPNIDAFSNESIRFEHCDAASSWTTPSHAAVFTGVNPLFFRQPATHFYDLTREFSTLAELSSGSGYLTAGYCEGVLLSANRGFAQGFQRYWEGLGYEPHVPGSSAETFGKAREWLERFANYPFFLFVHTYEAHHPYEPLEPYRTQFGEGMEEPEAYDATIHFDYSRRMYDAELAHVDAQVGAFLQYLKLSGLLENTHVILMSDHGEEFGEHGGAQHMKSLYEEVVHVPLIVRLAGNKPPSGTVDADVELIDVFSTAAELLELDASTGLHSRSLMPLIRGNAEEYGREFVVSSLRNLLRGYAVVSARDGDRKYIVSAPFATPGSPLTRATDAIALGLPVERDLLRALAQSGAPARLTGVDPVRVELHPGPREAIFDLQTDPAEQDERSDRDAALLLEMRQQLLSMLETMPAPDLTAAPSVRLSDQDRDELESMGYLD